MSNSKNTECPVCAKGPETLTHFLFECDEHSCRNTVNWIQQALDTSSIACPQCTESYERCAQILLDPSHHCTDEESINKMNVISTQYIFHQHINWPGIKIYMQEQVALININDKLLHIVIWF